MSNKIANRGICTLCPKCNMNTQQHYLHHQLTISFCECKSIGGLHIGFVEKPFWKLFADIEKSAFLEFAQSANAYVDVMRETHLYSESA